MATPPDAHVYGCGPEPLLDALERAGVDRPVHVERFRPRADAAAGPDRAFDVLIASTGVTLRVDAGVSVLDTLGAAGLPMPSSCREGTCASCETAVLDGGIEHRDSVLSAAERESGKTMMVCVSRATSPRLVLDL